METTLHLKTSVNFISKKEKSVTNFLIARFVESCLNLDASIFEPYMQEDDVFEDKEKYLFLTELHGLFENFREDTLDDFNVTLKETICKGCAKGKPVKHFEVYKKESNIYVDDFSFLIDVERGILKDIYRCYDFVGCKTCRIGADKRNGFEGFEISLPLYKKSQGEALMKLSKK